MKNVCIILLSIFTLLFFISCGSKPAAEEQKPVAPDITEAVEDLAEDAADSSLAEAAKLAQLMEQVNGARKAAIEAGADRNCPDQMNKLDYLLAGLKDSDDPDGAAQSIIDRYNLLANYSKAVDAKDEIDENGYDSYAPNNYDRGVDNLDKVDAAFEKENYDKSVFVYAENALKEFNTVINVAYKKIAKEEREAALEAKKDADSVKAGVARKTEYKEAADLIQTGDSLYAMQNAKKATEKYIEANDKFTYLFEDVSEKRAEAQAAIEEAKRRVAESKKFAEEADVKAPITEKVEGIEDEDAVLLEADDYEDPEDAEADIAEELEDEIDEAEAK
ncbi:MAG: hypothetical protein IKZ94_04900 [Lachnospiraceae bacterium]|nr:hypothetical protein [Lachnospiraceae bacterium]